MAQTFDELAAQIAEVEKHMENVKAELYRTDGILGYLFRQRQLLQDAVAKAVAEDTVVS